MEDEKLQTEEGLPEQQTEGDRQQESDGQQSPEQSEVGKLKAEIDALKAEIDRKRKEIEFWRNKYQQTVIRVAVINEATKLGAINPELIFELIGSKCELVESDGEQKVVVNMHDSSDEDGGTEAYELPKAIMKLFARYPYLRQKSSAKGAGSKTSDFSPITLESLKSLSLDELRARKDELERLAKAMLG
ncbi:MAG TPA: hypothetical protein ENF73_05000 [Proteobacteria bacterium]|nr:hypothetical protein [Pseudomonadota bacterium]